MAFPSLRWISGEDNLVVPGSHNKVEFSDVISLSIVDGIGLGCYWTHIDTCIDNSTSKLRYLLGEGGPFGPAILQ